VRLRSTSARRGETNRGIGTTIIPIRVGARPETTVFELVRGV
jgi:predicted MPP superfamily phosphohydrolase